MVWVEWVCVRPRVYDQFRRLIHQEQVLAATGVVDKQGAVVNGMAKRFETFV